MSGSSHADVMLAGAFAAFTVDMLIYPLDTLKTRQQSRDFVQTFKDPKAKTRLPSRELFRGLYQGIGIVVIATLPAAGTFFTVYEAAKSLLGGDGTGTGRVPLALTHSAASSLAECASCLVLTPAEVIKQNAQMLRRNQNENSSQTTQHLNRNQSQRGAYPSMTKSTSTSMSSRSTSLQALRQLGGAGAGRKLLSGYTALVARNLPFTAIQFPIFEFLRERLWGRRGGDVGSDGSASGFGNREKRSLLETGVVTGTSAGLAGSFAALVTTPMDVVKTRMMLAAGRDGDGDGGEKRHGKPYRAKGGLAVAREVVAERGVAGLFRGAVLRSVWTTVGSGLYLGMYEVSKAWLAGDKGGNSGDDSFP